LALDIAEQSVDEFVDPRFPVLVLGESGFGVGIDAGAEGEDVGIAAVGFLDVGAPYIADSRFDEVHLDTRFFLDGVPDFLELHYDSLLHTSRSEFDYEVEGEVFLVVAEELLNV
jgi:hypothetical protein